MKTIDSDIVDAKIILQNQFETFVFRIVRQMVTETYENDDHYDITFVVIVFVSFLPTVFMPWFFVHWVLIGQIKTSGMKSFFLNFKKHSLDNEDYQENGKRHISGRHGGSK